MQIEEVNPPAPDWLIGLMFCVLIAAPIAGAYLLDRRRVARGASAFPLSGYDHTNRFVWGYFLVISVFMISAGLLVAVPVNIIRTGNVSDSDSIALLLLIAFYLTMAVLGLLICRLNRWAFALFSLLTFNPILWLVNAAYASQRWTWRSNRNL